MRRRLLRVLACPACRGALDLLAQSGGADDDWIEDGKLACAGCPRQYPIRGGVPNLLLEDKSDWSFNYQWKMRFGGKLERGNWLWGHDLQLIPRAYRLPAKEGVHLDCGSGSGDHTRRIARENPNMEIVGLDMSNSVYSTSARDRGIPNLNYVQGDILSPPFKDSSFRTIVSVGVWHATGDTRRALHNCSRLLQEKGFVATWLYPNLKDVRRLASKTEYRMWRNYYFFRDYLFLGLAHRLKPASLFPLCKAVCALISPFLHIINSDMPDLRERYRSNLFILLDDVSPQYQDRPSREQVQQWFREVGINKVAHSIRRGGVFIAVKS